QPEVFASQQSAATQNPPGQSGEAGTLGDAAEDDKDKEKEVQDHPGHFLEAEIENLRTGEQAIAFFAKHGGTTRRKFVYARRRYLVENRSGLVIGGDGNDDAGVLDFQGPRQGAQESSHSGVLAIPGACPTAVLSPTATPRRGSNSARLQAQRGEPT
ncbi:unnamed protein product, partial [Amoebophrya sp. A120]